MSNIKNELQNLNKTFSVELCSTKKLDFESLSLINPLFYSVTWHQTHSKNQIDNPALTIAKNLAEQGKNVMLHLPCRYLSKQNVYDILLIAQKNSIKNIFALQGDPIDSEVNSIADFHYAIDLVKFIKEKFENYFVICVAGYPLIHPEAENYMKDLNYLKEKVNAGADIIITQMIFEEETFYNFYKNCRNIGINIPIMPGIYIINSYNTLTTLSKHCRVYVPEIIWKSIIPIKNDNIAIHNFGQKQAIELINNLLQNKNYPVINVHLFSLNNIKSIQKLKENVEFF